MRVPARSTSFADLLESRFKKIYNDQLFIGNDERPPQVINHPKYGPVPLTGEEDNAYIYDLGNGMEPIVIRKK